MRSVLLLICLFTACSSSGSGGPSLPPELDVIAAGPATGTLAGTPFTLGTRFMNISSGDLFVDLLPVAAPDCTLDETDGKFPFIIFFVPPAAGTYPLGDARSVTFVDAPSDNLIVSNGVIQIDSVTTSTVTGGLHVFDEEFGEVNGRFDGALCFSN